MTAAIAAIAGTAAGLAILAAAAAWRRGRRRVRQLEAALEEARNAGRDAADARELFFDLVTHELRSPLSAILGYQELLADGAFGALRDDAADAVERIGRSASHLLHLIEGVVLLSRLSGSDVPLQRAPVSLALLLTPVADAFRAHARERNIQATVRIPERLPTILTDQDQLVRALDLLVTSAVKHPAANALELEVELHDDGATVHVRGTALRLQEHEIPELRLGLRLAVVARIAAVLGGELVLSPCDAPVVRALSFRIRGRVAEGVAAFDGVSRRG